MALGFSGGCECGSALADNPPLSLPRQTYCPHPNSNGVSGFEVVDEVHHPAVYGGRINPPLPPSPESPVRLAPTSPAIAHPHGVENRAFIIFRSQVIAALRGTTQKDIDWYAAQLWKELPAEQKESFWKQAVLEMAQQQQQYSR
ncbi:hypothetical protein HGRIS_007464 [Hohenbuehelia grisea]|uniref:HMG box domain-containing protein n=1 Tax=Hohenbuehelia grisea TaxID=104357 RepID=A0ABR3J5D3_9AGAR